ncbi:alpha/beta fold hydrolase [Rhizobium rhizogenes]|uniref:alpha/beta hydrolase n=1 Tax=Rhizobium rhizogenes TaxID=359 RepID=UPI00166480F8|nr:alpha/beta fold hydrolase [Rhizobium rhizogenes]
MTVVKPVQGTLQQTILVVTTREPDKLGNNGFTSERSQDPTYLRVVVSVPPGHKPGTIEWPRGMPNAASSFAVIESKVISHEQFVGMATANRKALVFVHGYNNNFQESLFRLVQISADAGVRSTPVLFAWPSRANFSSYLSDRDSSNFSRDELAQTLEDLGTGKIETTILAHSMGSWLTVEALRQLRLQSNTHALSQIDQVILAAPDIDIDVFRKQLKVVGKLEKPIIVLSTQDDLALATSRWLAGASAKAGALDIDDARTIALAEERNLQIIDISDVRAPTRIRHDRFVTLATMFPRIPLQALTAGRVGTGTLSATSANSEDERILTQALELLLEDKDLAPPRRSTGSMQ